MKTNILIVLSFFASFLLSVTETWAEVAGYSDSTHNFTTNCGVLGAVVVGKKQSPVAICGEAYDGVTSESIAGKFINWSAAGKAVSGIHFSSSGQTFGGYFESRSTKGTAVFGAATAKTGTTYGGNFFNSSTEGKAVYGLATASTGATTGGYFMSLSEEGTGVYGSGSTGVFGWSHRIRGIGVSGYAHSKKGQNYGGNFESDSNSGIGVSGKVNAKEGKTFGGYFRSESTNGKGVFGIASAKSGANYGGAFESKSPKGKGVVGLASSSGGASAGVYGQTNSPSGYGVYSKGNMKVVGKFTCTGSKSAVVKIKNGEGVNLYAVEAAENWFEDFGSAKLKDGTAVVAIDPVYAETVNTEIDYHVFLTPRGECEGLYVINQKENSFEVREMNGGKSDISLSYRIVAKRKGYETVRLAKVKEETFAEMDTPEADRQASMVTSMQRKVK